MPDLHMGECFAAEEFIAYAKAGFFTPDDGSGYWGNEHYFDNDRPVWSASPGQRPSWGTHVAWFAK